MTEKNQEDRKYYKLLTVISLFFYSAFCFAYVGYMINSVGIRGIFQKTLSVENFDFYVAMAFLVGFFGMVLAILGIGTLLQKKH